MKKILILLFFILAFPLASCSSGSSSSTSSLSLLYLQEAHTGGTLSPGTETDVFTLTLNDVGPTMYVADRPNRVSGTLPTAEFVAGWDSNNFNTNPPNAVLEVNNLLGDATTMALELSNPQYDAASQTLTYTAQRLETYPSFYPTIANDGDISGDFTSANLFIDNGGEIATQVSFSIVNDSGAGGSMEIYLNNDTDLTFGMTGNSTSPSLSISNPLGSFSLSSLTISPNIIFIEFPNNGNSSSFTLDVYVVGSSSFLLGEAVIPPGVNVQMTINGLAETLSSGEFSALLQ